MRVKLDIPISLDELCRILNTSMPNVGSQNRMITAITTDTRDCCDTDLFIALGGAKDSGEKYIDDAIKKKCLILSSQQILGAICVPSTEDALLKIANLYKSMVSPKYTVAITGSVGKSTTVQFLSVILREKYKIHSPKGNFNNHIGLPLTILEMPRDTEVLILEAGMNHKNEISRLSKCSQPDLSIITKIGTAHIGNLGSREAIAVAKSEIIDGMKIKKVLVPHEESLLLDIEGRMGVGRNTSSSDFSLNDASNGRYIFISNNDAVDCIEFFDKREHLLSNLSFAIAAAKLFGLTDGEIIRGVKAITYVNLRQKFIELSDFTIFDDSYNASLESITEDLKFISSQGKHCGAFLGDVLELGECAAQMHEKIGRVAGHFKIGHLYLYGRYAEHTAKGAMQEGISRDKIFINTDLASPDISVTQIRRNHLPGELILFKASHMLRLDKIADMIANQERMDNDQL